jgi:ribonuclease Z
LWFTSSEGKASVSRVVVLGSAAAVPDEAHANTYLAVEQGQDVFLVDCPDNPLVRFHGAGLSLADLRGLFVTHFHPDHVCGAPILLMDAWLLGRKAPLQIYGPADVVERLGAMMDLFRWQEWPGLFPIEYRTLAEEVGALALETDGLRISSAPVKHLVPTVGLRFDSKLSGGSIAYSSDTAPCEAVVALAEGADVLIHEAATNTPGHSSAAQAGEIARRAGVGRLVLIHYRPDETKYECWLAEAAEAFGGSVELAQDLAQYEF